MSKLRPLLAAVLALGFYTITDILVWQRIFEANQLTQHAGTYHAGWFASLAGYATVGVVVMSGHWRDCAFFLAALFIGAYSGLEDVLYYVLDRRPMPDSLPWLANNPMILGIRREDVIASVVMWLAALVVLYAILYRRRSTPALGQLMTSYDLEERRHISL